MNKGSSSIGVFIIDDSAVARQRISAIIERSGQNMRVVGTAPNGRVALEKLSLPKYKSNVIITDVMMPEMDGIETVGHIMDRFPTPIILISAFKSKKDIDTILSELGIITFETGVVEFVKKPDSGIIGDDKRFEREILRYILSLAIADIKKAYSSFDIKGYVTKELEPLPPDTIEEIRSKDYFRNKLIIIGASTGGPRAISLILSKTPSTSPPIVIVQHMPDSMMEIWVNRLSSLYPDLRITLAKQGERILPNRIYVAPADFHCVITANRTFNLVRGEKINFVRPAIDVTFQSASQIYGSNLLGVVLTGMGKDGTEGAKTIKKAGGYVFAEHESTTIINSMPKAVIDAKLADKVISLHEIPYALRKTGWI